MRALSVVVLIICLPASSCARSASSNITPNEEAFLQVPNPDSARTNLRFITSKPHVAGTAGDFIMADFVAKQFSAAGIPNVSMFDLDVLLNYPESAPQVSLLSSSSSQEVLYQASLSENVEAFDDTSDTAWRNHTFHGYSPSGDVTGPLIYANYGRPADFDALEAAGIDINNTVVLVRYGKCFRGLKVMNAQKRGALAVIIYSDPADDGYGQGKVYPAGPWRPETGVQRGSVQFLSLCAGDPLRADQRYEANALQKRCGLQDYKDLIPRIPSVPMSYGDALPLLQQIGGQTAMEVGGDDFVGGLNVTYRVGPSNNKVVHVVVENYETVTTIPNVVAHIPGTLGPELDMPVLLGNHRDAWVYGAADPNSGTASLIEVARGLGKLVQTGWRPRRSIYLLSWSGEEYGLLGSTGWAELNADEPFLQRAVTYLNVDTVVSGDWLQVATTPSLGTLWNQVLDDLSSSSSKTYPKPTFANGPVGDLVDGNVNWIMNHPEQKLLGSGSDYTAFLDHLGITSMDFSFHKHRAQYGQYHSIYDSFAWMDAYGSDRGMGGAFDLMALAARIWGLLALRLADANVLPLDHVVQGEALQHYLEAIARQKNAVSLDLKLLKQAIGLYQHAADALHEQCGRRGDNSLLQREGSEDLIHRCNEKLGLTERKFLTPAGLPDRPWFRHILQAPGMYLGYAAESFPGVQYALEKGVLTLAQEQVDVAAARILVAAGFLHPDHANEEDLLQE